MLLKKSEEGGGPNLLLIGGIAVGVLCLVLSVVGLVFVMTQTKETSTSSNVATSEPIKLTNTPALTPTPKMAEPFTIPDLSGVRLLPEDFPEGFREMGEEELADLAADIEDDEIQLSSLFGFIKEDPESFHVLYGFTIPVDTYAQTEDYDSSIDQPDGMLAALAKGVDPSKLYEQREIKEAQGIGDISAGITILYSEDTGVMRMNLITFRHGVVTAFLFDLYQESTGPSVRIVDLTQILDSRAAAALSQ